MKHNLRAMFSSDFRGWHTIYDIYFITHKTAIDKDLTSHIVFFHLYCLNSKEHSYCKYLKRDVLLVQFYVGNMTSSLAVMKAIILKSKILSENLHISQEIIALWLAISKGRKKNTSFTTKANKKKCFTKNGGDIWGLKREIGLCPIWFTYSVIYIFFYLPIVLPICYFQNSNQIHNYQV